MLASSQSGASPVPLSVRHGQLQLRYKEWLEAEEKRLGALGIEFQIRAQLGAASFRDYLMRYNESQGAGDGPGA